jgi:hypothetical protein
MERYCAGEVNGRSFLISGHRGAGKTTLVSNAFLRVWSDRARIGSDMRPLLVLLHGPTLFPHTLATAESRVSDTEIALRQMVLGLHRAASREFSERYRSDVLFASLESQARQREIGEAAAQLEAELYECPTPARLRQFWHLRRALEFGVLFPDAVIRPLDQGFREMLALSGVCDAYCRISGTLTFGEKRGDSVDETHQSTSTNERNLRDVVTPLATLLTGGLAGAAALSTPSRAFAATAVGLVAALCASVVFKTTTTRTRKRAASRDYSFLMDLSVATLDRVLPMLIERLRSAGLAPVFVVDELDKVEDLPGRIFGMVRHLKKLVAENAFFCFLTDRSYFEEVALASAARAFPIEHTYYTHRLFVVFRHEDYHRYLHVLLARPSTRELEESAAEAPEGAVPRDERDEAAAAMEEAAAARADAVQDELVDWRILPFVLLHRSRMHTIDLARQISAWRTAEETVSLAPGAVRTQLVFRLELAVQLAIEIMLARPPLRGRLARDPEFRRLAHDALYYPSRMWESSVNQELNLEDGAGAEAFGGHLDLRTGALATPSPAPAAANPPQPPPGASTAPAPAPTSGTPSPVQASPTPGAAAVAAPADPTPPLTEPTAPAGATAPWAPTRLVSDEDRAFLLSVVREMVLLLSDPAKLRAEVAAEWTGYGADEADNARTRQAAEEALPPASERPILERTGTGYTFRWNYTPSGLPRFAPAPAPVDEAPMTGPDWEADVQLIEAFDHFLANL